MIETRQFGPVTQFIMGRTIDGNVLHKMACYYVDGLLIDTGPHHVGHEIPAAFQDYPVQMIVNTHHHEDHIGNNHVFQKTLGLGPVLAHPLAVPKILNPYSWTQRLLFYQHYVLGEPLISRAEEIGAFVDTPHYRFNVLHTPGHSEDHICLLEEKEGWLFAGDLFMSERLNVLRSDENAPEIITSLEKILPYTFTKIFSCSGKVIEDGKRAVRAQIAYWRELQREALNLYEHGYNPEEISQKLLGEEWSLYEFTEGDMGKINLIQSLMGVQSHRKG